MDIELFVRKLQEAVGGRPEIDRSRTEQIVGAVFSALSAGLASSDADRLISMLPPSLQKLWYWRAVPQSVLSEVWKEDGVAELSRKQFFTLIQMEGDLASAEEAEAAARCVIHLLKEMVGSGGIRDAPGPLASQLREWIPVA